MVQGPLTVCRRSSGSPYDKVRVEDVVLTVPELVPVEVLDRPADPEHHRVGRRGVPLAGRPQPRVDVGEALGDLQELQGAPGLDQLGLALDPVDKGLGLCVEV